MRRKLTEKLLAWKSDGAVKPLVLYGARQVGKSYAVTNFGRKYYRNIVVINFEANPDFHQAFQGELNPDKIIRWLATYLQQRITEQTLIFFDEIQQCPRALTALKYFAEANELRYTHYQIVAAGSLLGVTYGEKDRFPSSYPVGKVEQLTVYPMDFEEFLWAQHLDFLAQAIRHSFQNDQPLSESFHERAETLYRQYLVVGGMPEVVKTFLAGKNFLAAQERILNQYREDMVKYIRGAVEKQKVLRLYASVAKQLGSFQPGKKFRYTQIEENGTAKKYRNATDWLCQAHLVIQCLPVRNGRAPLVMAQEETSRKLYYSDTGLLCHQLKITFANLVAYDNTYLGMLTENYAAVALQNHINSQFESLHFWITDSPDGQAEVDFIFSTDFGNVPLEVKSGFNTKSKSLSVFLKNYQPALAYRVSNKNFGCNHENHLKSIPHYALFCFEGIL